MRAVDRPVFLVVEDDGALAQSMRRLLRPLGDVEIASTVAEGRALLARSLSWSALFIDVGLPDGNGLDVLRFARDRGCSAPALVFTALLDRDNIASAFDLDAQFLAKGGDDETRIIAFAARALAASRPALAARLERWVEVHGLTATEAAVLFHATRGVTHDQIAIELDIAMGTLRTHVTRILAKTGFVSLFQAALMLLGDT